MSDSNKCGGSCSSHDECGEKCGHGFNCNKSYFFVRWIFGLIILLIVFCVGVQIGRFCEKVSRYNSGYTKMMRLNDSNYGYGAGMMQGWVTQE